MLKKKNSWQTRKSHQNTFWTQAKEQKHQWPHNSDQQPLYIASWEYKIVHPFWKIVGQFLEKLNIEYHMT